MGGYCYFRQDDIAVKGQIRLASYFVFLQIFGYFVPYPSAGLYFLFFFFSSVQYGIRIQKEIVSFLTAVPRDPSVSLYKRF